MAKVVYKSYNRNEGSLFPVYLSDMVAPEHPARVVDAVVDSLDISGIERGYKGGGTSSYEPRAMLKVIIYSYLTNIYSGRQMAKLWKENIVYMWLGGTVIPDFRTINNFRSKRLVGTFDSLFTQVVELLHDEGLVSLKVQYVDGTKMREYEQKLDILGERNSCSKTDPDATFMRMKEDAMNNGQTKPGYNVQISTENQYITNYGIYWQPNDQGTFIPFMTSFSDRYGFQSDKAVADSGYGSEQNYAWMDMNEIEAFVKYNMFHAEDKRAYRNNPFLVRNLYYNAEDDYYVCPMGQHMEHIGDIRSTSDLGYVSTISRYRAKNCAGCPLRCLCYKGKADFRVIEVNHRNDEYRAQAKERLTSEEGLYHRSRRPVEPEAVFGDIKFDHGFKRFRLKGNAKVKVEFGLVALAHNLRKYARVQTLDHPVSSEPVVMDRPKTAAISAA